MENKFEYSFDDEPVSKFCFDIENKKIEIHFAAYNDLLKNKYIEEPCVFRIENWLDAKSKFRDEEKLYELNKHIGIFQMILFMEQKGNDLELLVNTIDNRIINLIFIKPILSLNK